MGSLIRGASMNGSFSLIQYCPDRARREFANVGLVLLCPEIKDLRVRISGDHSRVRRFFNVSGPELVTLREREEMLVRRIENSRDELSAVEGLDSFAQMRVNRLLMTRPTSVLVSDPATTFEALFEELVGVPTPRRQPTSRLRSRLRQFFAVLVQEKRAQKDVELHVPVVNRTLEIDYAYRNGVMNLVKIQTLDERKALSEAFRLRAEWDLIQRGGDSAYHGAKLVIPLPQASTAAEEDIRGQLTGFYGEYEIPLVLEEDVEAFETRVNAEILHARADEPLTPVRRSGGGRGVGRPSGLRRII